MLDTFLDFVESKNAAPANEQATCTNTPASKKPEQGSRNVLRQILGGEPGEKRFIGT